MDSITKRYRVCYDSDVIGHVWVEEFDNLEDFEYILKNISRSAQAFVWDEKYKKFVFWKDAMIAKPRIDDLHREVLT